MAYESVLPGQPHTSTLSVVVSRTARPVAVVISFIDRINRGDVDGLAQLMTDDHELRVHDEAPRIGRDANIAAWRGYIGAFPDYLICPHRIVEDGGCVAVLGYTTGSHLGLPDEEERRLTVIWLADVVDGSVRAWRVLEDDPTMRAFTRSAICSATSVPSLCTASARVVRSRTTCSETINLPARAGMDEPGRRPAGATAIQCHGV